MPYSAPGYWTPDRPCLAGYLKHDEFESGYQLNCGLSRLKLDAMFFCLYNGGNIKKLLDDSFTVLIASSQISCLSNQLCAPYPYAPCMEYVFTFTINLSQM